MKNSPLTSIRFRMSFLAELFAVDKFNKPISTFAIVAAIIALPLTFTNTAYAAEDENSDQLSANESEPYPLLGSTHAESFMSAFCSDQPDSAEVPLDPRELIQPGVNAGRAVAFNAYWEDCTEASGNPNTKPKTCGEYRERREKGEQLMR